MKENLWKRFLKFDKKTAGGFKVALFAPSISFCVAISKGQADAAFKLGR